VKLCDAAQLRRLQKLLLPGLSHRLVLLPAATQSLQGACVASDVDALMPALCGWRVARSGP
jgi:hypothetical protein